MTAKEAIEAKELLKVFRKGLDSLSEFELIGALDLAIEALKLEQKILDNGYTGKEAEFRIGGRLFGIREKAQ